MHRVLANPWREFFSTGLCVQTNNNNNKSSHLKKSERKSERCAQTYNTYADTYVIIIIFLERKKNTTTGPTQKPVRSRQGFYTRALPCVGHDEIILSKVPPAVEPSHSYSCSHGVQGDSFNGETHIVLKRITFYLFYTSVSTTFLYFYRFHSALWSIFIFDFQTSTVVFFFFF